MAERDARSQRSGPGHTTVLVDAWHLGGYSANRGIGTYLRNVLAGLADEPDLRVFALATPGTELPRGVSRRTIRRNAPARFAQREHDLRLPFDLARSAKAVAADVVLSPADDPPRRSRCPWVQVLHDLIPMVIPDPAFERPAARWRRVGPRLRGAAAVVAVSGHSGRDAELLLGVDPRRVRVAPHGVAPSFTPPTRREARDTPTILYVGEYGPHKGFAEAFAVAGRIADAGLPHRLEMVGYLAPMYEPIVLGLLANAPRADRVDVLGYVDDVVASYQRADALIVTSRYEGFCLPALEAMACGTPVVAFANSAIPEVVGDGGVLVPDGDVPAMAAAVQSLLTDTDAWQAASGRGVAHASSYTWKRSAEVLGDVLREAAGYAPAASR